jgi:hypothetical protein
VGTRLPLAGQAGQGFIEPGRDKSRPYIKTFKIRRKNRKIGEVVSGVILDTFSLLSLLPKFIPLN